MKNETKSAIALRYNGITPPQVTAKGQDELAEKIINEMKRTGGLIHSDETLLKWLSALEIGDEIPKPLFLIIAQLIAYAWYLDGKTPPGWEKEHINEEV